MTPRTGRPKKEPENKMRHETRVRMSDDDLMKLDYCARQTGRSKADIIREGIEIIFQRLMKGGKA